MTSDAQQDKAVINGAGYTPEFGECRWRPADMATDPKIQPHIMEHIVHIAIFNTDIPVPEVSTNRASSYGQIFHELLTAAGKRISPSTTILSTEFDSRKCEYPESLDDVDLILVTGSVNSAYDNIPWVHRLEKYIIDTYRNYAQVKWFGSCFGHQLICQALLKQYGVRVDADERGWELGVQNMAMNSRFRSNFAKCPLRSEFGVKPMEISEKIKLQFVHGDLVVVPDVQKLPSSWSIIGTTPWCANQGMYETGRILTFQGHFEFDRFVNGETIKTFFAKQAPEWLEKSLKAVDADDDAEEAAEIVLQFIMQRTPTEQSMTYASVGGLATPP